MKDIDKTERVKRRATNILEGLKQKTYQPVTVPLLLSTNSHPRHLPSSRGTRFPAASQLHSIQHRGQLFHRALIGPAAFISGLLRSVSAGDNFQ